MFLLNWYRALSLRWKIQFGFLAVTMITTLYNRWIASGELKGMVLAAREAKVDPKLIVTLEEKYSSFIANSFWESGLEFLVLFMIIAVVVGVFIRPIHALCTALKRVENGDLTQGVENNSRDEIGILERSFNNMLSNLDHVLGQMSNNGRELNQSANQIATISKEISQVSEQEQQRALDVSSGSEQLHQLSQSVQNLAGEATERANSMQKETVLGIDNLQANINAMQNTANDVNRASEQISELATAAGEIHDIIGTINSIAEQTNLLSLNAAIEAARAGEQGRGFAVVADEVRALANSTSQSANKISSIIDILTSKVHIVTATMDTVVEQVNENNSNTSNTAKVIQSIADQIHQSAGSNDQILVACEDQLQQFDNLRNNMDILFSTLDDNSTKVQTTAKIGEGLLNMTQKMNGLISGFEFSTTASDDDNIKFEKRAARRAKNTLFIKVRKGEHRIEGISQDISLTGMQLHLAEPLNSHEIVVDIFIPCDDVEEYSNQDPLRLYGESVWDKKSDLKTANPYVYGVKFNEVTKSAEQKIMQCFRYFNKKAA